MRVMRKSVITRLTRLIPPLTTIFYCYRGVSFYFADKRRPLERIPLKNFRQKICALQRLRLSLLISGKVRTDFQLILPCLFYAHCGSLKILLFRIKNRGIYCGNSEEKETTTRRAF